MEHSFHKGVISSLLDYVILLNNVTKATKYSLRAIDKLYSQNHLKMNGDHSDKICLTNDVVKQV